MLDTKVKQSFLLRLHPLHRIGMGLVAAFLAWLWGMQQNVYTILNFVNAWVAFCLLYLVLSWVVLFKRRISEIRKLSRKDDGSKIIVFILILFSAFANMFGVLMIILARKHHYHHPGLYYSASVGGMLLSWIMVHTIFTFHYAHLYYGNKQKNDKGEDAGLNFPGDEKPDYLDFAYFAFVIGCTFQVSDVQILSKKMRHLVAPSFRRVSLYCIGRELKIL